MIKLQEQHSISLDKEIKNQLIIIEQQKNLLTNMGRQRDRTVNTSHTQSSRADKAQLKLDFCLKQYADMKEACGILQSKLSHLKQQYESLMSEHRVLQHDLDGSFVDRDIVQNKLQVRI